MAFTNRKIGNSSSIRFSECLGSTLLVKIARYKKMISTLESSRSSVVLEYTLKISEENDCFRIWIFIENVYFDDWRFVIVIISVLLLETFWINWWVKISGETGFNLFSEFSGETIIWDFCFVFLRNGFHCNGWIVVKNYLHWMRASTLLICVNTFLTFFNVSFC